MKRIILVVTILFCLVCGSSISQSLSVNTTGATADPSALLDVNSTSKGFLPPRMTTVQRDAITSPATGLVIFNTNTNSLQLYNGSGWVSLITPSTSAVFLPTIVIGTQQWMSKNLDVAFYRNGDPIPQVTDPTAWAALTTGAWCYYNNDSALGNTYGKLYNWYAINDPRGLAPTGWHIPSSAEWNTLGNSLGGLTIAGGKMKEAGTIHWTFPNTEGNNNSGFTGLPGGYRDQNGTFIFVSNDGWWWSSTEYNALNAYGYYLRSGYVDLSFWGHWKRSSFSVRCVRD